MGLITNVTACAAAAVVGRNIDGRPSFTCVVKAEYTWGAGGTLTPVAAEPIRVKDELESDPDAPDAVPAVAYPSELGPRKRRTDVIVVGAAAFRSPVESVDATLSVGARLRKTLRITGDRLWLPSATGGLRPSRPKPFTRMPIAWGRSFGGSDPDDPGHVEMRNPVGVGLRRQPSALKGTRLPNFEDPRDLVSSPKSRPVPVGFGAVAGHWMPRSPLAGTYDKRWNERRRPLLPEDFDPAFYNAAPHDQQLDAFDQGDEVRLINLTLAAQERFVLPNASLPIIFVTEKALVNTRTMVDTIVIDPEKQRLSLISRAEYLPRVSLLELRSVVVGTPSHGLRRAIERGKRYVGRTPSAGPNAPRG
jgi:hypothetical protein